MSETFSFKLEGFKELNDALMALPEELKPERMLRKAVRDSVEPILTEAKERCPVDTGRLVECLVREMGKVSLETNLDGEYSAIALVGTLSGGSKGGEKKLAKLGLTDDAYYGKFVELGTRFEKPEPFLGPAFDSKYEESINILAEKLDMAIDKACQKAGIERT